MGHDDDDDGDDASSPSSPSFQNILVIILSYLCPSSLIGCEFFQLESPESEGFQCAHPALIVSRDTSHEIHRCIAYWLVYLYTIATTDTCEKEEEEVVVVVVNNDGYDAMYLSMDHHASFVYNHQ